MPDEHPGPAGAAAECRHCPVCAGLAALREARPEVAEHLVKAGAELLLAARALLEGVAAAEPRPRAPVSGNGLQRIDVG